MGEESKAAQEIARTAGKGIDAIRELGGFVAKYVGGPIETAMGIVDDKLKYLRWERQVRLMERANNLLAERGLAGPNRTIPLQIAIPILQGGSLEEDDELQDRWAALLVNAADASAGVEIRRAFASILEDLTPLDALILEKIYSVELEEEPDSDLLQDIWTTFLPDRVETKQPHVSPRPPVEIEVSIGNLARLGLLTTQTAWGGVAIFSIVHRTLLGREFLRACSKEANQAVKE